MKRNYYEAMAMADFALEGNTETDTAKEFRVTKKIVYTRMKLLARLNPSVYKKVMEQWHKNDDFEHLVVEK